MISSLLESARRITDKFLIYILIAMVYSSGHEVHVGRRLAELVRHRHRLRQEAELLHGQVEALPDLCAEAQETEVEAGPVA